MQDPSQNDVMINEGPFKTDKEVFVWTIRKSSRHSALDIACKLKNILSQPMNYSTVNLDIYLRQ